MLLKAKPVWMKSKKLNRLSYKIHELYLMDVFNCRPLDEKGELSIVRSKTKLV